MVIIILNLLNITSIEYLFLPKYTSLTHIASQALMALLLLYIDRRFLHNKKTPLHLFMCCSFGICFQFSNKCKLRDCYSALCKCSALRRQEISTTKLLKQCVLFSWPSGAEQFFT